MQTAFVMKLNQTALTIVVGAADQCHDHDRKPSSEMRDESIVVGKLVVEVTLHATLRLYFEIIRAPFASVFPYQDGHSIGAGLSVSGTGICGVICVRMRNHCDNSKNTMPVCGNTQETLVS